MLKYGAIIINEDEVIESIQSTSKNINEDDNFYSLLNKVLRKQIFIFERELLKAEECMSQKNPGSNFFVGFENFLRLKLSCLQFVDNSPNKKDRQI